METELAGLIAGIESKDEKTLLNTIAQIEAFLLRMCGSGTVTVKRASSSELDQFTTLQDSFAFNIVGRLAIHIDRCIPPSSKPEKKQEPPASIPTKDVQAAVSILRVVQGLCLIHRGSRQTFNNDKLLQILIDGVGHSSPEIQTAAINTLVAVMVRQVEIIRRFERLKGLKVVCDTFKHRFTAKQVKLCILEFLFFYLIPETRVANKRDGSRKTTSEKQLMLGRYLSNVDGLVRELEVSKPFGTLDLEW